MELESIKLNLTPYQINKIKHACSKKTTLTIQLKPEQINTGNNIFKLTNRQINKLQRAKQNRKGSRIQINYNNLKSGGFLPLVFAGLGALGALAGGVAGVANSVIDYKDKKVKNAEIERHNKEMEKVISKAKKITIGAGCNKKKKRSRR